MLQLGAELISSDAVAFYELVKNAFDAGSPRVDIDVCIRIPHEAYQLHLRTVTAESASGKPASDRSKRLAELKDVTTRSIDKSAPGAEELRNTIEAAETWEDLSEAIEGANYIDILDTGSGMDRRRLTEVYLTIGTRARLVEREQREAAGGDSSTDARPILGEKGLGRLSAMRLGWRLDVRTGVKGEKHWHNLAINWAQFSHDSDALVEDIVIKPTRGQEKEAEATGTRIRISALKARWSKPSLDDVAASEFSRFTDPFERRIKFPISLRFNDDPVEIPRFEKVLLEHAHADAKAEFSISQDGTPELIGQIHYTQRGREKTFRLAATDLVSASNASLDVLRSLGPFEVWFHWFNRRALSAVEGIGDKRRMQALVNRWSGGLMVYRDGFRVKPYGGPDDDWLSLDRKALASAGYKVNRTQIIGKVDISSTHNRALTDQTNREGLRDCEEKHTLVVLLKHILETEFRAFINNVDKELQARVAVTFQDLHERVEAEGRRLNENVRQLFDKVPALKKQPALVQPLQDSMKQIDKLMTEAEELAQSFEKGRAQVMNLASLGMMVEIVAHELNRATEHALSTLGEADLRALNSATSSLFKTLQAQLKTLQKRLRILDPLSNSGRQVKESFDLIAWVEQILEAHEAQFKRHGIDCSVTVEPQRPKNGVVLKMVKGMIAQILENLISNSVYWLKQQRRIDRKFQPRIEVVIKSKSQELLVTDNGPGVDPTRKDEIFLPFVTTKPPGEGKGLGLYIAREIASYHKAAIYLSDDRAIHEDRLNTFVLALGAKTE